MSEPAHETALKRLGKAQREAEHRLDQRNAAQGTAGELRAENDLRRAREVARQYSLCSTASTVRALGFRMGVSPRCHISRSEAWKASASS
jgi:hypothetical protein